MGTEQYIGTTLHGKFHGIVNCVPKVLDKALHWETPQMVAVCLMGDLFHEAVPEAFIVRVFQTMWETPQHTYQILTKRPERMGSVVSDLVLPVPVNVPPPKFPNVWLGTSVENQETADERIPRLLNCPAAVRFLSIEPMLGEIDLQLHMHESRNSMAPVRLSGDGIDWVIVGGESGPGARPMNVDWARSIRDQCQAADVPLFLKQMGSRWARENGLSAKGYSKGQNMATWPEDLRIRQMPATAKRKE
jgi:protein gp37